MTPEEQATLMQLIKNIKSCYNTKGEVGSERKGGFLIFGGSNVSKEDKLDGYIADLVDFSSKASENDSSIHFADFIMTVADELIHNKKGVTEGSTAGIKRSNRVNDFRNRLDDKLTEQNVPIGMRTNVSSDIEKRLDKLFGRKPQVEMISNPAYNSSEFGQDPRSGENQYETAIDVSDGIGSGDDNDSAYSSNASNAESLYESYNGMSTEEAARRASGELGSREFYGHPNTQATQSSSRGGYYDAEYVQSLASNNNSGRPNTQAPGTSSAYGRPITNASVRNNEVGVDISGLSTQSPYNSTITSAPGYSGYTSQVTRESNYAQPLTEDQALARQRLDATFNKYCQDPNAGFRDDLLASESHLISSRGYGNVTVKPNGVQALILQDEDSNSVSMIKNNSGAFRTINFTPGESSPDTGVEDFELDVIKDMIGAVNARIKSLKQKREAATQRDQGKYKITAEGQDTVFASQDGKSYEIPMEDDADAPPLPRKAGDIPMEDDASALPMKAWEELEAKKQGGDQQEGVDQIYSAMPHNIPGALSRNPNKSIYMNIDGVDSGASTIDSQKPGTSPATRDAATLLGASKSKGGDGRGGSG